MTSSLSRRWTALAAGSLLLATACGSDDDAAEPETPATVESPSADSTAADVDESLPTIAVTTNVLGDVVNEVAGGVADVVTIMPVGADPHDFQASAQEVDQLLSADGLIVNGAAFEEGLLDVIESAIDEGVPTFEAIGAVETIDFAEGGHGHEDEKHEGEAEVEHEGEAEGEHENEKEEAHEGEKDEHSGEDPHFFTDPVRMADAVNGIVEFLSTEVEGIDVDALRASADDYLAELATLHTEVEEILAPIADDRRVMVTNHEVFGYFADRYDFEIVGVVVPGGGTADSASAAELAELAEIIEQEGVPAIFADTSSSADLTETLAAEVGNIEIVELFTESLGDADSDGATYLAMVRTNAERISAALS